MSKSRRCSDVLGIVTSTSKKKAKISNREADEVGSHVETAHKLHRVKWSIESMQSGCIIIS